MVSQVNELKCTTREKEEVIFYYHFDNNGQEITFRVNVDEHILEGEFFELRVIIVDDKTVRIDSIYNCNPALSAKGIPDALIPEIVRVLKKNVVSSSDKDFDNQKANIDKQITNSVKVQYRNANGDKIWKRMLSKGLAKYDSDKDQYIYIG